MNNDHPHTGGDRISLVAHEALIEALDAASAIEGATRAHLARRILAEWVRENGFLAADAPASKYEARHRAP